MLEWRPMTSELIRDVPSYRITLFFGPEPVEGTSDVVACVFNVKKRSWKAGVQVVVEISVSQLAALRHNLHLADRLAKHLKALDPHELPYYEARLADCFAQAVSWCKLDLRLRGGLTQDNQRIAADDLTNELNQAAGERIDYIVTYILEELDLAHDPS
jgi:hypothetical protein